MLARDDDSVATRRGVRLLPEPMVAAREAGRVARRDPRPRPRVRSRPSPTPPPRSSTASTVSATRVAAQLDPARHRPSCTCPPPPRGVARLDVDGDLGARLWFRVERQTLRRLPGDRGDRLHDRHVGAAARRGRARDAGFAEALRRTLSTVDGDVARVQGVVGAPRAPRARGSPPVDGGPRRGRDARRAGR